MRSTSTSTGSRPRAKLHNTVLMPILGKPLWPHPRARASCTLRRDGGSFTMHYHDWHVHRSTRARRRDDPAAEGRRIAGGALRRATTRSLADLVRQPAASHRHRGPPSVIRRHRDKEVLARRSTLVANSAGDDRDLAECDRRASTGRRSTRRTSPSSIAMLEQQNYRLAYPATAGREARLSTLLRHQYPGQRSARIEDRRRLRGRAHVLLSSSWVQEIIGGLRIDHPGSHGTPAQCACSRLLPRALPAQAGDLGRRREPRRRSSRPALADASGARRASRLARSQPARPRVRPLHLRGRGDPRARRAAAAGLADLGSADYDFFAPLHRRLVAAITRRWSATCIGAPSTRLFEQLDYQTQLTSPGRCSRRRTSASTRSATATTRVAT